MAETLSASPQDDEYLNTVWQDITPEIDPTLFEQMKQLDVQALSRVPFGAELLEPTPYQPYEVRNGGDGEKPKPKTSTDTLTTITHPTGRETTDYPKDED